jgi:hypothetical protein
MIQEVAMHSRHIVGFISVVLFTAWATAAPGAQDKPKPAGFSTEAARDAAKASPDLVGALAKELGSTPEQAAGAAGALFGVAKSQLKAEEFGQIAKAVPGMSALLKAAPPAAAGGGAAAALSKAAGSAGGLAAAASAFSKLGLKPELVSKAVPALLSFVTKSGGADVGRLLASVLK